MKPINLSHKLKNPLNADNKDFNFDFSRKKLLNPFKREQNMIDVCIVFPVAWKIQGLSRKYDCLIIF